MKSMKNTIWITILKIKVGYHSSQNYIIKFILIFPSVTFSIQLCKKTHWKDGTFLTPPCFKESTQNQPTITNKNHHNHQPFQQPTITTPTRNQPTIKNHHHHQPSPLRPKTNHHNHHPFQQPNLRTSPKPLRGQTAHTHTRYKFGGVSLVGASRCRSTAQARRQNASQSSGGGRKASSSCRFLPPKVPEDSVARGHCAFGTCVKASVGVVLDDCARSVYSD